MLRTFSHESPQEGLSRGVVVWAKSSLAKPYSALTVYEVQSGSTTFTEVDPVLDGRHIDLFVLVVQI